MARIGIKGFTYAGASGGDGSAMVYTSGKAKADLMVRASVNIERDDVSQYADNHRIEHVNGITGGSVDLELARLPDDVKTDLLGYVSDSGLVLTEDESPYAGFGYITKEVNNGTASYRGRWYYKAQFSMNSFEDQTKGESTAFGTDTITATLMGVSLTTGAKVRYLIETASTNESTIRSWLNTQAGITGT